MQETVFLLLMFAPLVLILWLANLADKQRDAESPSPIFAILTYLSLVGLWGILLLLGGMLSLAGLFLRTVDPAALPSGTGFEADILAAFPQMGLAMWLPALFGLLFLLPPIRRLFARFLNIEAHRLVHAVALSYSMLIVVQTGVLIAIGLGNIADMLESGPELSSLSVVTSTWVQALVFFSMAFVGVGWLARRHWGQSLIRLGIVRPSWRQVIIGLGVGVGMALLLIPVEYLVNLLGLGFDEDVNRLTEAAIGPLFNSIPGILTLGLAAALGEEAVFRGALQPRFGLLVTAFLFALLHSQYGLTLSTLVVFGVGLVLGWMRIRHNTSTAMIVHAIYNITLGLLTFLSLWPEF
ncbi:MAG: CPBP family intramembrane metalloprotease [Caldilineales bacterium]|nr:CPBP family intramembrane metalloprotease [Caldilineales bacterium]